LASVTPTISDSKSTISTRKKLAVLVENKSLTPAALQAIRKVRDQKNVVDHRATEIGSRQHEVDTGKDQARVRENMKARKGSSEGRHWFNATRTNWIGKRTVSTLSKRRSLISTTKRRRLARTWMRR